jgi:NAD(P)-dependent dehydrogenase (short-subunit alcohol dehydrogenase family)
VAIVTGGTRGIGSGISAALAEVGYDLVLTYNSNARAALEFASELLNEDEEEEEEEALRVECVGGDISLPETRDRVFECLETKFAGQPLRVLVHNAGQYVGITADNVDGLVRGDKLLMFGDGSLLDEDTGRTNFDTMHYYQRMYGEAWIDLCERSLQRMRENKGEGTVASGGSIVGISSPGVCASYYGPDSSYSMPGSGKSLMEYTMRVYARQAASHQVNVNVIVPGFTRTQAWTKLAQSRGLPDEQEMMQTLVEARCPMKQSMSPRDIGNVVAFLCSSVGRYVTGTVLPVDGGMHLVS